MRHDVRAEVYKPLETPISMAKLLRNHKGLIMAFATAARANSAFSHQTHGTKQTFHKPHTSIGATGRWARTIAILTPLVLPEFIPDPEQRWRITRIVSVAVPIVLDGMWTQRLRKERKDRAEEQALAACLV